MEKCLKDTIKDIARYYIYENGATLKSTAEYFSISSSTVNKYLNTDLMTISPKLYGKVQEKKANNISKARFRKKKTNWFTRLFKK